MTLSSNYKFFIVKVVSKQDAAPFLLTILNLSTTMNDNYDFKRESQIDDSHFNIVIKITFFL